jgi:thiol:disulfide interchange protein
MIISLYYWLLGLLFIGSSFGIEKFCFEVIALDALTSKVTLTIMLDKKEILYKDSIRFSLDVPEVTISPWESSQAAREFDFGTSPQQRQLGYTDTVSFVFTVTRTSQALPVAEAATLHMHYLVNTTTDHCEQLFKVPLYHSIGTRDEHRKESVSSLPQNCDYFRTEDHIGGFISAKFHLWFDRIGKKIKELKAHVTSFIGKTNSLSVQLILIFALGILMSFTPCIYPMIPITVGVLQISPGQSLIKNFTIASMYTCGVGLTFAALGLLAASGGAQFGQLLGSPIFVLFLVFFLAYLGLSMLGFYELYIPRFLQKSVAKGTGGGPLVSAFLFGALSGTIASPCISPGLALVLTLVATLGNKLLGFLMLFIFGVGSSMPLLIIGTFSNSVALLPRAGLWMVEVKRLFGFMLLGMCFFYLKNMIPLTLLQLLIALLLFISGIYYSVSIARFQTKALIRFKHCMSVIFVVSACVTLYMAYKTYVARKTEHSFAWFTDYDKAREQALQENKKLFLDFGASWCSSCVLLEKRILYTLPVSCALENVIKVKLDCTGSCSDAITRLQKKFGVIGLPTLLLVDPEHETLHKKWGGELLEETADSFAQELQKAIVQ